VFIVGSVFICSTVSNPNTFLYIFGVGIGIGKGLMYSTVLKAAWTHLPGRKGIASGIIVSGFGFGGFIFGLISRRLCNPNNISVMMTTTASGVTVRLFPDSVAQNVPHMLRTLDLMFFVMIVFGILTVTRCEAPVQS
jgi:hypothetical protein